MFGHEYCAERVGRVFGVRLLCRDVSVVTCAEALAAEHRFGVETFNSLFLMLNLVRMRFGVLGLLDWQQAWI